LETILLIGGIQAFDLRFRPGAVKWEKITHTEKSDLMARKKIESEFVVSSSAAPARRRTVRRTKTAVVVESSATQLAAAETVTPEPAAQVRPTHDEIARLAYSYWESRGYQGGSPEEDWTRAEAELSGRASAAVA
jgi:hypothetical protein